MSILRIFSYEIDQYPVVNSGDFTRFSLDEYLPIIEWILTMVSSKLYKTKDFRF